MTGLEISRPTVSADTSVGRRPYWLTAALVTVSQLAAIMTFVEPGILTGPAAMNGSARGTALVVGVVAVPLLALGAIESARGSLRGVVFWLGAAAYLTYNAVMFLFATPFNQLFLLYTAMLSLSLWTIGIVLLTTELHPAGGPPPGRAIAIYMWATVGLNLLAWLRDIVPATLAERPTAFLDGTGLTTNPVFVQDLALWLPLATAAAVGLWRRRPLWTLIAGAMLTMWVLESISIAVDQAFGYAADPTSAVVSSSVAWMFAVLAIIGLIPLLAFLARTPSARP
jgi:hypothetical protein